MGDPLDRVLGLVAAGRLTAAEAAPILDALGSLDSEPADRLADDDDQPQPARRERTTASSIRIEVTENGRRTINLRIPVSLGRLALDRIPGLSGTNADLVRQALADGRSGTLLAIDDEGDGVRIALE